MKHREPPTDHSGIGPHISMWMRSKGCLPSHNGESANFGFVSRNDNAHRSPSLSGASGFLAWDLWPSRLCHKFELVFLATFTNPSRLIAIIGYKLLYLCVLVILRFPRLIIHVDSFRVVLYPSSASMPMETRLLFSAGTCHTWWGWSCFFLVIKLGHF
mgnify:CR=1 FL=1